MRKNCDLTMKGKQRKLIAMSRPCTRSADEFCLVHFSQLRQQIDGDDAPALGPRNFYMSALSGGIATAEKISGS